MRGEIAKLRLRTMPFENRIPTVIVRESGRSNIPETSVIEPKNRGVLDTPPHRGL
jgi:hypothetical protein